MQKKAYYVGIAELLGKGFDVALKPNLEFDKFNNAVAVRDKDRTRFPLCHARLIGAGGKRRKTIKKKAQKKRKTLHRRKH